MMRKNINGVLLMEKLLNIAQVIAPILAAVVLGMVARRREIMTAQDVRGLQQFVMKFGLPCVIFNSCLTADIGAESLTSMVLVIPSVLFGTLWAFRTRKKALPYHNLPQLFTAQETGMLGIPLFMILFGTAEAYRMGVLDLAQAVTAYPTIAILSAASSENPSPKAILKSVLTSPLLIMSALGLTLNISGIGTWLDSLTRWATLMYCTLPASYLAPTLGRSQEDYTMASGVCSLLTIPALLVFCIIAAFVS